jgi:hypothetical protein
MSVWSFVYNIYLWLDRLLAYLIYNKERIRIL